MKRTLAVLLATIVIALGLLLGTSAVTVQAQIEQTIEVNPGTVGKQALDLTFTVDLPGAEQIDLVFTGNKTLKFGPGPLSFLLTCAGPTCADGVPYGGILLDAEGNEIPGTNFEGIFELDPTAVVNLDQLTEWSGMRFNSAFTPAPYAVIWVNYPTVDTSDTDPDSDNDGLPDDLENTTCTDPNDADTDDDGISDGTEDLNLDGIVDSGETDPCNIDSDGDGIQDGTEVGYVLDDIGSDTNTSVFQPDLDPDTTTDPLDSDTDDDGFTDGREDSDLNGRVDEGETDPNDPNSSPVASFSSAAAFAVLANLYFDAAIANAVNALDDPSYYPVVALNASKSYKYAEDTYDDATAALAAAGQDYTFWGYYAPIYAESDIIVRADAVDSIILAAQYAAEGDLELAEYYLGYGISLAATADLYNGSTIWCASMEASGQAAAQQSSASSEPKASANGSSSFTNAANYAVLANMNFATSVSYGVTAFDDPSYLGLVQLYAQTAYDYAVNEYNEASAALAAAGQDSTFWGVYAVQYAESDMNNKADALSAADQALQAYYAGDLETTLEYLISEFLSAALADVYNASTILCASIESAGATK